MLRKTMMACLAAAALIALAPHSALARGGFGGFGGHGGFGGFHGGGGWHGGGIAAFHGAPMGGGVAFRQAAVVGAPHMVGGFHPGFHPGFRRHAFIAGAVYAAPYGYYDGYDPYYAYPDQVYYDGGYVEPGCTVTRERVLTRYGWRYRTVQVCE